VVAAAERELRAAQVEVDEQAAGRAHAHVAQNRLRHVPFARLDRELRAQDEQPEVVGAQLELEAFVGDRPRLAQPAGQVQRVGEVDVGRALLPERAAVLGQRERLAQRRRALVDVAESHERAPERVERAGAQLLVAERIGHRERLARDGDRVDELASQHEGLRARVEQRAALRRDLAGRQQRQRVLAGGQRLLAAAEVPLRVVQRLQQARGTAWLLALVDERQRRPGQRLLADGVAVEVVGLGGAPEQRRAVGARERLRVGDAIEELDRALEQRRRLAVGVNALGGAGGEHRRAQRRRLVAGRGEVVGDLGGEVDAQPLALGARLERLREAQVERRALPGQEVVVHHLAQQRVAEAIAPVGVDGDDVVGHRLAQRLAQGRRLEAGPGAQELVVELLAHGNDAQDLLRGRGQPLDAHHERVAERRGQRAPAVESGCQQLLDEEWVTL